MSWKHPSPGQLWARERNFSKRQVKGLIAQIQSILIKKSTPPLEYKHLRRAQEILKTILTNWDIQSAISKDVYLEGRYEPKS